MFKREVFPSDNTLQFPNDLCYSFHSFVENEDVCILETLVFEVTIEKGSTTPEIAWLMIL